MKNTSLSYPVKNLLNRLFGNTTGERISWTDLSERERIFFIEHISNGCGYGGGWMNKLLDKFLWGKQKKASCDIHDFYHMVGGGMIDFLKAQFVMWAKQVEDSMDRRDILMFLASFIYVTGTTIAGLADWFYWVCTGEYFLFEWGRYVTKREVLGTSFDEREDVVL